MLRVETSDEYDEYGTIETIQRYIGSNMGRLMELRSGLLRGLSALSRNSNGDAEEGIKTLKRMEEELQRFDSNELTQKDYVTAYFVSTISSEKEGREELLGKMRQTREILEKVKNEKAAEGEIERAQSFLDSMIDQMKHLSREYQIQSSSTMFGVRKNGFS